MPVKRTINGKTVWRGRIEIPDKETKKRRFKEKTFLTKKEAVKWEVEKKEEITSILSHGITCGEWLDSRLDAYVEIGRSEETISEKTRTFARFFKDVPNLTPCSLITEEMIKKHLKKISKDVSADRANRTRNHLAEAWRWGVKKKGLSAQSPFDDIPEFIGNDQKALIIPEMKDFWNLVERVAFEHQVMLRTYYYTAARADELKRLRWHEVNFTDSMVKLSTRKGRSGKWRFDWLRIPSDLMTDLKKLKLQSQFSMPDDRVFCDPVDGGEIKNFDRWMDKRCREAKVTRFGFKGIRHLVAVSLYRAGHPVAQIQRRLRHKTPTTTEIYLRSLGFEIGSENVIETLENLEMSDFLSDKEKGSATV